jgi:hypothetical protein
MYIPDHLVYLVRVLAHQHLAEQIQQLRWMGHDHPQSRQARFHLEQARELADVFGPQQSVAA